MMFFVTTLIGQGVLFSTSEIRNGSLLLLKEVAQLEIVVHHKHKFFGQFSA